MGQAREDVDPPAEVLGAERRGAHQQVQRRARSEVARQPAQAVVQQRRAGRPVVLEARARAPRHEHQLERQLRGIRRDQHRLLVDRDDPLAQAHLLGDQVAEQALAHRARRVGVCALALAGHDGRHEVQRVQLRVRVRQRGSRLAALVDDQLHVGATRVRAHALAPHLHRGGHLLDGQLGQRQHRLRPVDDHLVRARRRERVNSSGLPRAGSAAISAWPARPRLASSGSAGVSAG